MPTIKIPNVRNLQKIYQKRFAEISVKKKRFGLLLVAVIGFCVVALCRSTSHTGQNLNNSPNPSSTSGDSANEHGVIPATGLESSAKPSSRSSTQSPPGLTGMSAVELHVRESTFLQETNKKTNLLAASYDLYFLYQDEKVRSRAEVVFRNIALQSIDAGANRIEILVPDQDVGTILALEMMGEYQIVRRSLRDKQGDGAGKFRQQVLSTPLGDRDWVKRLVGDDTVVVVP